jgi:hypothetical protein
MLLFRWSGSFADRYVEYVEVMLKKQRLIEINEPANKANVLA